MQKLQKFLEKESDKQKLIVIYGPTWAGKTDMSIEIAKYLSTEIISTDSRQIYRGMNIGTGKITPDETKGIVHHMIDIINPDEEFSVWDFSAQANSILQALFAKWKIPMLVGGTGLYINSLIFDYKLPQIPADIEIREELQKLSNDELYEKLVEIDPEYAQELHPNNRPYIERAIEVKMLTWKSKTEFRKQKKLKYDVLFLTPYAWDRKGLYSRINMRVKKMFDIWLEKEVRGLIEKWYGENTPWMKSIGYQEFFPYFHWKIEKQEIISRIQQNSRNYAKRQLTWFRDYPKYIEES